MPRQAPQRSVHPSTGQLPVAPIVISGGNAEEADENAERARLALARIQNGALGNDDGYGDEGSNGGTTAGGLGTQIDVSQDVNKVNASKLVMQLWLQSVDPARSIARSDTFFPNLVDALWLGDVLIVLDILIHRG